MTRHLAVVPAFLCVLLLPIAVAKKKPPSQPVNLNTATSAQLQTVPGIGPSTADKILQTRKSYGAFKSVNDLLAIRGIGEKRLDKMRKYLTVNKPSSTNNSGQAARCTGCAKQKPRPPTQSTKNSSPQAKQPQAKPSQPTPPEPSAETEEPK